MCDASTQRCTAKGKAEAVTTPTLAPTHRCQVTAVSKTADIPSRIPYFLATVGHLHATTVEIQLRSGSSQNIIGEALADHLELDISVDTYGYADYFPYDGVEDSLKRQLQDVVGLTSVSIYRNGLEMWFDALVVKSKNSDGNVIIGGAPFMEANDISVRPSKCKITFCDDSVFTYDSNPKAPSTHTSGHPPHVSTITNGHHHQPAPDIVSREHDFGLHQARSDPDSRVESLSASRAGVPCTEKEQPTYDSFTTEYGSSLADHAIHVSHGIMPPSYPQLEDVTDSRPCATNAPAQPGVDDPLMCPTSPCADLMNEHSRSPIGDHPSSLHKDVGLTNALARPSSVRAGSPDPPAEALDTITQELGAVITDHDACALSAQTSVDVCDTPYLSVLPLKCASSLHLNSPGDVHHSPPQVPHIVLLPRSDDVRPSPVSCNRATVPPDDTPLALHHPPDSSRDMPSITPTSPGVPPPPLWISQLMPSCFPPWPPDVGPPKEDPHAPAGCFEPHSNDSIPPDTPSLYHMFSHRPWLTPNHHQFLR